MQKFHTDDGIWVVLLIDRAMGKLIQPIRSTTQIWVVTRHQYGISALVSQTSFGGETSGSVAKCRMFSQVSALPENGNKIDDCLGKDNFFTL